MHRRAQPLVATRTSLIADAATLMSTVSEG